MSSEGIVLNQKIGYRDVFTQKEYMKSIIANVINRFGDSIDTIALAWIIYTVTKSPAWTAIIFGVNFIPNIFLQPFAGALVENMNKKFTIVITDIIRGLCVCLIAVMYINNVLNPWILIVIQIVISSAESFGGPAATAMLPNILEKEYYEFGMSMNTSLSKVSELIGLSIAGGVIAMFGTQTAIFIDSATFFCSALIISFIRIKEEKKDHAKIDAKEYIETLKGGLNYIKQNRLMLNFILLAMFTNGILVPLNSLLAPLVKDILRQGEYMLSVLSISMVIGMGVGTALYPYVAKKLNSRYIVIMGGMSISIYYLLLAFCGVISDNTVLIYVLCAVFTFVTGVAVSQLISVLQVQFVKQVEPEYLARVGAIMGAGCVVAMPIVSFGISILTKILSICSIYLVVGVTGIVIYFIVLIRKVQFE